MVKCISEEGRSPHSLAWPPSPHQYHCFTLSSRTHRIKQLQVTGTHWVFLLTCRRVDLPNFVLHCKYWEKYFPGASKDLYILSTSITRSLFLKIRLDGSTPLPAFTLSTFEERQIGSNIQICSNILNLACIINLSYSSRKNSFCPCKSYIFGKFISCVTLLSSGVVTWRMN